MVQLGSASTAGFEAHRIRTTLRLEEVWTKAGSQSAAQSQASRLCQRLSERSLSCLALLSLLLGFICCERIQIRAQDSNAAAHPVQKTDWVPKEHHTADHHCHALHRVSDAERDGSYSLAEHHIRGLQCGGDSRASLKSAAFAGKPWP